MNKIKPLFIIAFIAIIGFSMLACDNGNGSHACFFGTWAEKTAPTFTSEGVEERNCDCGENETRPLPRIAITTTAEFATVIDGLTNNTATTAYTLRINIDDLGGSIHDDGSIGYTVFNNNTIFVNLDMSGSTFIEIDNDAFGTECRGCENLMGITIPNSVTMIGGSAFEYTGIISVIIPANVVEIGYFAFNDCVNLETVTVLATTPPTIFSDVFTGCCTEDGSDILSSLVAIKVPAGSVQAYKEHVCGNCESCEESYVGFCGWSVYEDLIIAITP